MMMKRANTIHKLYACCGPLNCGSSGIFGKENLFFFFSFEVYFIFRFTIL